MKTARELGHEHTSCNGDCCALGHEHTTACAHNRDCDRLTAAIEARDREHIDIRQEAVDKIDAQMRKDVGILNDEANRMFKLITDERKDRDLARSQLETAVGALKDIRWSDERRRTRLDPASFAASTLDRIKALATIQQPKGGK